MKVLDRVNSPEDVKKLTPAELNELCADIRGFLVENVSKTGGHLAANLGIVELTVAIHSVFDTSTDRLVFDVGHQSYVHKILTGRKGRFATLRQYGGIAGFPKPSESVHDAFIAGHASNSISAALGMARARTLKGEEHSVIALIGDGALSGGLSYEAMSDAGDCGERLVIILNDNGISIGRSVGGVSRHLASFRVKPGYLGFKRWYRNITKKSRFGRKLYAFTHKIKTRLKNAILHCSIFEDMGLQYLGPVDGHDVDKLIDILSWAKEQERPTIVHVKTKKGKGYEPSERDPDAFHGVSGFDPETGEVNVGGESFSSVFGRKMVELAAKNDSVIAVTAAMTSGTGLADFAKRFPDRFIDVGIAEGHAVTMSAGAAKGGLVPVFAVYSTFLQRGYDMLIHDAAISGEHVVFAVDRAGLVGADGETHHGVFDAAYLTGIPGMSVLCPASFRELEDMLEFAVERVKGPVAVRYPRGGEGIYKDGGVKPSKLLREGSDFTIITYGVSVNTAIETAAELDKRGVSVEVLKLDFISPIDMKSVLASAEKTGRVLVLEEIMDKGCIGERIAAELAQSGTAVKSFLLKNLGDGFVAHGSTELLRKERGIDAQGVVEAVIGELGHE
ncbi:MAG: 1-deoxy-D-xylulose-5-phosphate synthase [Oscillospiraceae bacterium]|nr:1-deoxy-D-xylulose-5-phosphate synthase [Oscillospiraceae bacterium]